MPYIVLKAMDKGESRVTLQRNLVVLVLIACLVAGCSSLGRSGKGPQTAANQPSSTYGPSAPAANQSPSGAGSAPWCQAGSAWASPDTGNPSGAAAAAKVIGLSTYKDKTYCQAEYTMEAGAQKTGYTYFFSEDGKDVWLLMEVGGRKQELHLTP
jgi:hypothetical protein